MMKHMRFLAIVAVIGVSGIQNAYGQYQTTFDYTGAVLKSKNETSEEYHKPDGTIITKFSDREKAVFADGTVIVRYQDGKREIHTPDGTAITIDPDGSRRYVYADGRERTITLDGKTPYGEAISSVENTIQKGDAVLLLQYSAQFSDDHLDGYMKKFFDELADAASRKIGSGSVQANYDGKIVVSQCRFCATGYCRRKNKKEVVIEIFIGGSRVIAISYDTTAVLKDASRQEMINAIMQEAFSKR